jgi:hypothetical protein
MQSGDKVRKEANPARIGVKGSETSDPSHRQRVLVTRLNLGNIPLAPPLPKLVTPQNSWADRYVDKDLC